MRLFQDSLQIAVTAAKTLNPLALCRQIYAQLARSLNDAPAWGKQHLLQQFWGFAGGVPLENLLRQFWAGRHSGSFYVAA